MVLITKYQYKSQLVVYNLSMLLQGMRFKINY